MHRYAEAYADLQFGWRYVSHLAKYGMPFTRTMRETAGPELRAAYNFIAHEAMDYAIMEAFMLAGSMHRRTERQIVEAALLSKNYTLQQASISTGLSMDSLAAYEKLFFNVVDRRKESLFIASVVYPNTRLVEMFDGYLKDPDTNFAKLLQRSGYNNGLADLMFFAGHADGVGLLASLSSRETTERLETLLMANGYLLARNGWINQRAHNAGVAQARGLIAAAKAGGESSDGRGSSPFLSLGNTLQTELLACKRGEAEGALRFAKEVREMTSAA